MDNMMELAFPIIVGMIFLEIILGWIQHRHYYRVNDTVAGVSTGIMFMLVGVPTLFGALVVYNWIERNFSIMAHLGLEIPFDAPLAFHSAFPYVSIQWVPFLYWAVVVIAVDFLYYWFHRLSHEINFLWGSHVTHHSSEEFNLAVSFRGGSFQRVFEYIFFLPLALIGVNWLMFLFAHRALKLYQFWVHTAAVPELGPLEYVMVTPSNHRVHHGRNPQYIDKNHGGIFIIWDRMFGTYEPEREKINYGITNQLKSFNPLWMTFHYYAQLWQECMATKSWKNKVKIWFAKPGWKPADLGSSEIVYSDPARPNYDPPLPAQAKVYGITQFALLSGGALLAYSLAHDSVFGIFRLLILIGFVVYGLTVVGGILDSRPWVYPAEMLRLVLIPLVAFAIHLNGYLSVPVLLGCVGYSAASLLLLALLRRYFIQDVPAAEAA
ncbi:MAG: sterol desaturase family protein [Leptospiraceae bacterium]|nr:sterol desaturase family protein [Leptospiraceae bacterium]